MLVFFIISIIVIFIVLSTLKIKIENFKVSNYDKPEENLKVNIKFYIMKYIKIISFNLNMEKIKRLYSGKKPNIDKLRDYIDINKYIFKNTKVEKIYFDLNIGTGEIIVTTFLITILATILSSILPKYIEGKLNESYYKIQPIYDEEIKYKINLNCIINIKTVHIIHIIYLILKKRNGEKYVRTSNRKSYESSYE